MAKKPSPPAGAPAAVKGPVAKPNPALKADPASKPAVAIKPAALRRPLSADTALPKTAEIASPAPMAASTALTPPTAAAAAPSPAPATPAPAPTLKLAPAEAPVVLATPIVETPAPVIAAPKVEPPAPVIAAPKVEPPKIEAPKVEVPKVEAKPVEAPKPEAKPVEAPKADAPALPTPVQAQPEPTGPEPGFAFGAGFEMAKPLVAMMPAPETIRHMAETGLKQVRDQYATVKDVAEGTTEALGTSFDAATKGMSALQAQALEGFRSSANATFDLFSAIVAARSLSEAVALQASHARRQIEALTEQNKAMLAIAQRVANDINEPLKSAASQGLKRSA